MSPALLCVYPLCSPAFPKLRVQEIKILQSAKDARVEDGLENLDLSFRGDEGNRRNIEIKIKMWKKISWGRKRLDQKVLRKHDEISPGVPGAKSLSQWPNFTGPPGKQSVERILF